MRKFKDIREACFVCTTPFQILGAIAIVLEKKIKADLYIFSEFLGYEEVAKHIKATGLFSFVTTIKHVSYLNKTRFKVFVDLVFAKYIFKEYLPNTVCYKKFYSTTRSYRIILFTYVLTKRFHDIKYIYYEDGMGTYVRNIPLLTNNRPKLVKVVEFFTGKKVMSPKRSEIICLYPSLVELPGKICNIQISKMPQLDFNNNIKLLCDVFSFDKKDSIKEKVIFFDEFRGFEDKEILVDEIDKCIEMALDCFSHEIVCKPHPRSYHRSNINVKYFSNHITPMEIVYATMEDLDSKILIGNLSTALFTPKMMFNKEPYVISIHRLTSINSSVTEPIYEKFSSIYLEKNKIFAPKSIEQFKYYINTMANSIGIKKNN